MHIPGSAGLHPGGLGDRRGAAGRARRRGRRSLAAPSDGGPQPRPQPADGALLRRGADGAADGGAGAVLVGHDLIGQRAAVDLAWVLWTAGTVGGLFTAVSIPFLMFTQHDVEPDAAFGGWLMPVVPPMVSAATGALLIPHMPPGSGAGHHVLRLLRDVRAVAGGRAHHHLDDLEPAGALRDLGHRAGADAVDRARPAGSIHHRRRASRPQRRAWRSTRPRRSDERLRHPLRRPGVGIRRAVDRAGHRADRPHHCGAACRSR